MVRFVGFLALLSLGFPIFQIVSHEMGGSPSLDQWVSKISEGIARSVEKASQTGSSQQTSQQTESRSSSPGAASDRPRVILFTGTRWCPPCQMLERSVISTAEWREFSSSEITFQKVDVPRSAAAITRPDRELMIQYRVNSFPTMVVLDASGRELGRRVGAESSPAAVANWIRSLAGKS